MGLVVGVAIRAVGAQVEQPKAMFAHVPVHVAECRLTLVQLHELHLCFNADNLLQLRVEQRREDLQLGTLRIELHEGRDRTAVLGEEVAQ